MSKRWIQFGSALVCMIMIANLQYAWALFVKPLLAAHKDWGLVGIQTAASLFLIFETWVTPIEGWLIDRLGPRLFLTIGGVLVGIGWTGMAYAATLTQLKVLYSIAGVGAAFIYSGSVATALKWFPDKRGTVSGFITAGFGAGAALFIPTITLIITSSDYHKAFLYTGIAQGILIVIAAQFLHNPGADFHVSPAAKKPVSPKVRRNTQQFNSLQMLTTPHFYLLFVSFVLINTGGSMVTIQTAVVADFFKITLGAVTAAITLGRLSNGAGRIFWGWLSDRIGREMAMFIPYVLQSLGLIAVLLVGRTSGAAFTIFLIRSISSGAACSRFSRRSLATTTAPTTPPPTMASSIWPRAWPLSLPDGFRQVLPEVRQLERRLLLRGGNGFRLGDADPDIARHAPSHAQHSARSGAGHGQS